jgi:hypothetical protein
MNNGMISRTRIGNFRATWVLRHRWEEGSKSILENYDAYDIRRKWSLGIWVSRSRAVGRRRVGKDNSDTVKKTFGSDNLVNCYMLGLNLIVAKVWVEFKFSPTLGSK